MPHTVTIQPSGETITVNADETILTAALRQHTVLAYNCRSGLCGTCKSKLLNGSVSYDQDELKGLSDDDRARGLILCCQARPTTDVVIEAKLIDAVSHIDIRTVPCRVASMKPLAHDVMQLQLKLPEGKGLVFLPGQYINFLLSDGEERSFSIASTVADNEMIELHIRHVPGGMFTDHVFNKMQQKDMLRFRGPLGTFFLREELTGPIIFMAGGTGFAPIQSILQQMFSSPLQHDVFFYWGVRAKRDLYLHDLVTQWHQQHEHFHYIPVLSEPMDEDDWQGRRGWVHDAVTEDREDLSDYSVYASGPPPMILAAKPAFSALGLQDDHMFYDSFEFAHEA